jgi:hypothetical protein
MEVHAMHNSKILPWIAGAILLPIVLGVFGTFTRTVIDNTSRIGTVEGEFHETQYRLKRIEDKIDRLLDRR